ncbi:MAG: HigA family addiction module antidote protein [Propionibacteriaceae bacterium]|jgi:HTH-type transcriptional regulator/antitoxin HigA|nr:HigA family addiction module antidote protein [Propionibacteriaceae bacterium]
MTTSDRARRPDYAVPVGDFIAEWMDDHGLKAAELARRLGVSRKHVSELLRAQVALTEDMAVRLGRVTGVSADWWTRLESHYQRERARLAREAELAEGYDSVRRLPLAYLRKWGFVTSDVGDRAGVVAEVLAFFRVGTVAALTPSWAESSVAYRKVAASAPRPELLMTWLMAAERAMPDDLPPFDREGLSSRLSQLRRLTLGDPATYVQQATDELRGVGLACRIVPEVPGLGVYGATRWIGGHPLVQLSLRGKTDDQLWFTLFHELGHVLRDNATGLYWSGGDPGAEAAADQFAADLLIPPAQAADLPRSRNLKAVRDFAQRIGVAPGVVIGRIQRETRDFGWGNGLKRRFEFVPAVPGPPDGGERADATG